MEYFTEKIWAGWQTKRRNHWDQIYKKNFEQYERQLLKFRDRLSKKSFNFFTLSKYSLHDGRVISTEIIDKEQNRLLQGKPKRGDRKIYGRVCLLKKLWRVRVKNIPLNHSIGMIKPFEILPTIINT